MCVHVCACICVCEHAFYLLRAGLRHLEQLDEAVEQRHADGAQQHLEAGLHQLGQALHQAALAAVHLVVRRHHVGDEVVIGRAGLWTEGSHECV